MKFFRPDSGQKNRIRTAFRVVNLILMILIGMIGDHLNKLMALDFRNVRHEPRWESLSGAHRGF
jgi:hypothetical protein